MNEIYLWPYEKLLHIFVEILNGRGHHGSFLRAFADAFTKADSSNAALLHGVAEKLVKKYELDQYLDNYKVAQ